MPRYPTRYPPPSSFSLGPGPLSSAIKAIIIANVVLFFMQLVPAVDDFMLLYLGLRPASIVENFWIWQLATYMFVHGGVFHILFNMLSLWMFGTELERMWGTRYFVRFYVGTGVGAALLTVLFSKLPFAFAAQLYGVPIVGASGAIYGLLLAYALYFPDRPIFMFPMFQLPAKVFVAIMGAIALYASLEGARGVAAFTHLSGLAVGYLLLKGGGGRMRLSPWAEVKYRYLKWKINRVRKKFDVYSGGRADDWDRRVH